MAEYELSSGESDDAQRAEANSRETSANRATSAADSRTVDEEKEFYSADEFQEEFRKMAVGDNESSSDSDEPKKKTEEPSQKRSAKHDSGAADLERVTRFTEEKEIFSADEFRGAVETLKGVSSKLKFVHPLPQIIKEWTIWRQSNQ